MTRRTEAHARALAAALASEGDCRRTAVFRGGAARQVFQLARCEGLMPDDDDHRPPARRSSATDFHVPMMLAEARRRANVAALARGRDPLAEGGA